MAPPARSLRRSSTKLIAASGRICLSTFWRRFCDQRWIFAPFCAWSRRSNPANGMLALCGVQAPVREILDITGLTPMMQIFPVRGDGLVALSN